MAVVVVFVGEFSVGEVICVLVVIWRTACVCRLGVRSGKIKYIPPCCPRLVVRSYCCNIYNGKNERGIFILCLAGIYFVIGSWLLSLGKYSSAYSVYLICFFETHIPHHNPVHTTTTTANTDTRSVLA